MVKVIDNFIRAEKTRKEEQELGNIIRKELPKGFKIETDTNGTTVYPLKSKKLKLYAHAGDNYLSIKDRDFLKHATKIAEEYEKIKKGVEVKLHTYFKL